MRPRLALIASALLVAGLVPMTARADPAVRFSDHSISFFCEQPVDGGLVATHIDISNFGNFAGTEVWLDPAVPFEDPASLSGGSETVSVTSLASGFELSAEFPVADVDGNEVGQGSIAATLTPDGPVEEINGGRFGNRNTIASGTFQLFTVGGSVTIPGIGELTLDGCGGQESFLRVVETNPRSFVLNNEGVFIDCFWGTDDGAAGMFVISDSFGTFMDAFLDVVGQQLFAAGEATVDFTTETLSATLPLFDPATSDPAEATAEATLTPLGEPTSSVILTSKTREKLVEQQLEASGQLTFSTGQSFTIDATSCFANAFDSHQVNTAPSGPKPGGRAPANDAPQGALPLTIGSGVNAQTGGATLEPEIQTQNCPEGEFDKFGRTVWYTFEGTGTAVTLDTAGSNFDTVLAVYVMDGDSLVEIGCIDDVFDSGISFQAKLSGVAEDGVTYWIQIGGFDARDRGGDVEFGRLRVSVY